MPADGRERVNDAAQFGQALQSAGVRVAWPHALVKPFLAQCKAMVGTHRNPAMSGRQAPVAAVPHQAGR